MCVLLLFQRDSHLFCLATGVKTPPSLPVCPSIFFIRNVNISLRPITYELLATWFEVGTDVLIMQMLRQDSSFCVSHNKSIITISIHSLSILLLTRTNYNRQLHIWRCRHWHCLISRFLNFWGWCFISASEGIFQTYLWVVWRLKSEKWSDLQAEYVLMCWGVPWPVPILPPTMLWLPCNCIHSSLYLIRFRTTSYKLSVKYWTYNKYISLITSSHTWWNRNILWKLCCGFSNYIRRCS